MGAAAGVEGAWPIHGGYRVTIGGPRIVLSGSYVQFVRRMVPMLSGFSDADLKRELIWVFCHPSHSKYLLGLD